MSLMVNYSDQKRERSDVRARRLSIACKEFSLLKMFMIQQKRMSAQILLD